MPNAELTFFPISLSISSSANSISRQAFLASPAASSGYPEARRVSARLNQYSGLYGMMKTCLVFAAMNPNWRSRDYLLLARQASGHFRRGEGELDRRTSLGKSRVGIGVVGFQASTFQSFSISKRRQLVTVLELGAECILRVFSSWKNR